MKVKVSYTVDFDKVPELVTDIIKECKQIMNSEASKLRFIPHDHQKTLVQLKETRLRLASVDESLQDVYHIVSGWDSTLNPPKDETPPPAGDLETNE